MRTPQRAFALSVMACVLGTVTWGGEPGAEDARPVVVVFDFESRYDGGRMGEFVAKNLWAKLDRSVQCVLIDRDDLVAVVNRAKFAAAFDGKPEEIVKFAAGEFGATHAVWGKVEQIDQVVPESERGLRISVRAASAEDNGKTLGVDMSMVVQNQREIQLATTEAERLLLQLERPATDVGPAEEERWRTSPNLVRNPGFEDGKDRPDFWESISDEPKHPQHRCVSWVRSPEEGKGKCIRFSVPKDIAATYGAAYYSSPISIEDGTTYRFSIRIRSDGPTVKIFLKHYRFFPPGPNEREGQWRETRRAPLNCKGEQGQWATYTRDFRPHRTDHDGKFDPTVTRIELYAYWPEGVVYFDDVVLKKLK